MSADEKLEQQIKGLGMSASPELDQRILADAHAAIGTTNAPRAAASMSPRRRSRWATAIVSVLSVATLAMLSAVYFFSQPSVTWAQVAKEMKSQPWVHAYARLPDGKVFEGWSSLDKEINASRDAERFEFANLRTGITETYQFADKSIVRTSDYTGQIRASFLAFETLFQDLINGKEKLNHSLPGNEIASETRRTVTKDGKSWIEIKLVFADSSIESERSTLTFRVDPKTKLPVQMTATNSCAEPYQVTLALDYPKTGPEDIYALGVPRDAKVIDQLPKGDLKQIVENIQKAREQFDDYLAIQVWNYANDPWYRGTPMKLWYRRDPPSRRFDAGLEYPDFKLTETPDDKVDRRAWWLEHCKKFWYAPAEVQNENASYNNMARAEGFQQTVPPLRSDPAKWPKPNWKPGSAPRPGSAISIPIWIAYPDHLLTARGESMPKLSPGMNGNGQLIEIDYDGVRYTIDRSRGDMAIRTETNLGKAGDEKKSAWILTVEDAAKSPTGFWYPTRVRNAEIQDGKPTREDAIWQFYLRFDVKLTDEDFKPVDHIITDSKELK